MTSVKRHAARLRLAGAFAFLAFSAWIVVAPLVRERLDQGPRLLEPTAGPQTLALGPTSPDDLLARHGSFPVDAAGFRDPFTWIQEPLPGAGPGSGGAPGQGDPGAADGGDESAEEVPALAVSLVFKAGQAARAVVDGRIVGVGDPTRAGEVVEIRDDGVWTLLRGKKRFFALSPR